MRFISKNRETVESKDWFQPGSRDRTDYYKTQRCPNHGGCGSKQGGRHIFTAGLENI